MRRLPWFQTKAEVIGFAGLAFSTAKAGFEAWPDMKGNEYLSGGAILFYVLVATLVGLFVTLILSARKRRAAPTLTLPQRMLSEEADYLHRMYRGLDQDHREQVRLPLHNSSWPAFNMPWGYVHVTLFTMRGRVSWLKRVAPEVFRAMRWDTASVELFHVEESIRMADLLHARRCPKLS
jgi:hypothetical protein